MQSLRAKGLLIVIIPLLFEVVFAILVMAMDVVAKRQHAAELREKEITASAYRLLALLVDTETGIRGYIISGQPRFTEPYDRAEREAPLEIQRLRALQPELAVQVAALERLATPVLAYQTAQRDRVASGKRAEAAAIVSIGTGKMKMDAFRGEMARFMDDHRKLEIIRAAEGAAMSRRLRNVVVCGVAMNITVAAVMAAFFTTRIARRFRVVVENTFRAERQEPLHPRVGGRDEIAHLDRRFHDAIAALERGRRELESMNGELESFSYSVSHDLRAPLRAVMGYARMVDEDFSDRLDDEGRRFLATISSEAERMGRLIDDLLAFSRLGRNPLQLIPVDVAALAREALADIPASADPRVTVRIDALPPARADRAMLRHVLVNLLSNAIKFSSRRDAIPVEVGGASDGSQNVYWVRDEGAGFDQRFADKLFGVFQRLHAASEFDGTGVGLAIVARVIHRHGGRVWAESEEGRGACFYFTLERLQENET